MPVRRVSGWNTLCLLHLHIHHAAGACPSLNKTTTKFSQVQPADALWRSDGLRDFFLYKDLGIADATRGAVIAHLVNANMEDRIFNRPFSFRMAPRTRQNTAPDALESVFEGG